MTHPDYFTDRSHLLLLGLTGARTRYGGKTALATWLADTHGRAANDLVIFGNYKHDDEPERRADAVATTVDELAGPIRRDETFVCLSPTDADWEAVSRRLMQAVRALQDDMTIMVVHDETPELDAEAMQTFARVLGNGSDCKSVFISQEPGAAPDTVRSQSILVWVGPIQSNYRHVFRANDRENHFDYIAREHEPYVWTVMTGPADEDRDTYDPVPEEYAG